MGSIDFSRASTFIAAIPVGRWAAYKDVARAGGNQRGAMAVGQWLRHHGDDVPLDYRVLTVDGRMPSGFVGAGPGAPVDAAAAVQKLIGEGVVFDPRGRAAQHQRVTVADRDG